MMADVETDTHRLLDFREDSDETLLDAGDILHKASNLNDISLEGDITVPGAPAEDDHEFSTLDEPIRTTVLRDLRAVGKKFLHVFYPKESKALLREWDLWGPLVLCVFLSMLLQGSNSEVNDPESKGPEFAQVFLIFWIGSIIVTLNTKLLGGSISFFQSICVLGYCVLPLILALIICKLILIAEHQTTLLFAIRFILVFLAFGWASFASTAFLAESQPQKKKALAIYPICFFYFVISWMVISHTHN